MSWEMLAKLTLPHFPLSELNYTSWTSSNICKCPMLLSFLVAVLFMWIYTSNLAIFQLMYMLDCSSFSIWNYNSILFSSGIIHLIENLFSLNNINILDIGHFYLGYFGFCFFFNSIRLWFTFSIHNIYTYIIPILQLLALFCYSVFSFKFFIYFYFGAYVNMTASKIIYMPLLDFFAVTAFVSLELFSSISVADKTPWLRQLMEGS